MSSQAVSRRSAARNLIAAGVAGLAVSTLAESQQVHMRAALNALNNAKNQLANAIPDKAGHRERAIGLVNDAIAQVEQGIKAGAR